MAKLKPRALGRPALLDVAQRIWTVVWLVPLTKSPTGEEKEPIKVRIDAKEGALFRGYELGNPTLTEWLPSLWRLATPEETDRFDHDRRTRETLPSPPPESPHESPPVVIPPHANGHRKNGTSVERGRIQAAGTPSTG